MFSGQVVEALATVIKKEKEEDVDNKGEFKFFKCGRGHFVRSFMFLMSSVVCSGKEFLRFCLSISDSIILNSTSEFCRTLGEIPTLSK